MLNYVHFGTRFSWYDFHNCLHLTSDRKLTLALLASIVKSNLKAILFEKYTKKAFSIMYQRLKFITKLDKLDKRRHSNF